MYNAANNAVGILTAPIDSTSTEMTVNNGAVFPEPPFVVTLYDRYHNVEIIEVRAKNGDIFSELVRGAEGTISREWPMQTRVENRWTAGTYAKIMDSIRSKWEWDASAIMGVKVNSAKNADTVNNLAVETAVPPNAKFTDTIYTHPATHSADMIIENAARRFVSDSDISAWNAKEDSSNKGKADGYASLDANAKIPLSQLPDVSKQQTYIVSSPTEREALTGLITGDKCYETTTGDSYIWGGTGWLLLADADWENINLDWTNIVNKPASSVASIDDAVTKKHAHTNKAVLDAVSSAGSGAIITSEERTKLASIEDGANKYSLPTASSTVLGGVRVGNRLSISNGVLSADIQTDNNFTNALKTKLDGIEAGANKYTHPSTHPASMITGLHPSATTGVAGSVAWGKVTGKPSAFTPIEHTHEELSTVQALDAHAETRAALNKLGHVHHATLTATLNTGGWTGTEAPFVQVQAVSGILATDVPIVDVVLSGDWEVDEARLEAWGYIYRIVTSNNSITAYAREKPNVALPIQLKVVR